MARVGFDAAPDPTRVLAALPDLLLGIDAGGVLRLAAGPVTELTGWPADYWLNRSALGFIHPDDIPMALAALGTIQTKDLGEPMDIRCKLADGTWGWFEIIGRNLIDDPEVGLVVITARDVTSRRRMGVTDDGVERFAAMVEQAPTILLATDADGTVQSVNHAITRQLGWDASEVRGHDLREFVWHEDTRLVDKLLGGVSHGEVEARLRHVDGHGRLYRIEVTNLLRDPALQGLVVAASDITELDRVRQQLTRQAIHDPLTGLPNRRALLETMSARLNRGEPFELLYIDLDGFKPVNDTHGHSVGDIVLRDLAGRMRDQLGPQEVIARVGGDEFAAITSADAEHVDTLVRALLAAVRQPTMIGQSPITVDASIGHARAEPGEDPDDLLARADHAMYAAKEGRRSDR